MKLMLFSIFCGIFIFVSCKAKTSYEEIKEKIIQLETIETDMSQEEWNSLEIQIEELKTKLQTNRRNYSDEEIENINKLIGNYYAIKLAHEAKTIKRDFLDASQQLEGIFETFSKFYTDTIK
jgi:hypothetical protein